MQEMPSVRVFPLNMPVALRDGEEYVMQVVEVNARRERIRTAWQTSDGELHYAWFSSSELRVHPQILNG